MKSLNGQTVFLKGKVVDSKSHVGIKNVKVRIKGLPESVLSDANGNFELGEVPIGEVEILFKKEGYNFIGVKISPKERINSLVIPLSIQELTQLSPSIKELNKYREKVVVVTDKPYYYPREIIWLKTYLNYLKPYFKDSLSRVVYVELIRQDKKIVERLTLSLDSGRLQGGIVLPKGIVPGSYMLRAYTNFMKNFGEGYYFYKSIPILSLDQRVDPVSVPSPTSSLAGEHISSDALS
ncbi:MAG: carboxypeptidase-like regulatory domain-containing protein, partial [Flammeovirgaceae bacterium]